MRGLPRGHSQRPARIEMRGMPQREWVAGVNANHQESPEPVPPGGCARVANLRSMPQRRGGQPISRTLDSVRRVSRADP